MRRTIIVKRDGEIEMLDGNEKNYEQMTQSERIKHCPTTLIKERVLGALLGEDTPPIVYDHDNDTPNGGYKVGPVGGPTESFDTFPEALESVAQGRVNACLDGVKEIEATDVLLAVLV